jgi:hypothetical protein
MSPPPDFDALSPAELKSLVLELSRSWRNLSEQSRRCVTKSRG